MSIRALVLLIGLATIVHDQALAVTEPTSVDPREPRFEDKPRDTTSHPVAGGPVEPKPGPAKPPASATVEHVPTGNPLWAIPLSRLTATRQRPLFSPTRLPPPVATVAKPPPAPAPPPKPVEPEKPQLSLLGTVAGEEKIGLFMDQTSKSVVRLRAGDNHNGWILRAVSARQVELARGFDTVVLALPAPDMKAGAAPPPAMPAMAAAAPNRPAPPVNAAKATGALPTATPLPKATPAATIIVQPPTLTPPPATVNPFQNAPRGSAP